MERQSLNGRWQMRRVGDPVFSEAIVPGSVYTDLLRNGQMEDPFFKDNELKALRLMDEDYEYVTSFDCAKSVYRSDRKVLRFDDRGRLSERRDDRKSGQYASHLGVRCDRGSKRERQ